LAGLAGVILSDVKSVQLGPLSRLRLRAIRRLAIAAQNRNKNQTPLIISMIDQSILSAFSFLLNLALIKLWSPAALGNFVVVLSLGLIWSSVQAAIIGTQLSVLRPQLSEQGTETKLLATLWAANCVLMASSVLVSALAIAILWRNQPASIALTAGVYVGSSLLREYVRSLLFSERRPVAVLATDLLYVLTATVLLVVAALKYPAEFGVSGVLSAMTCANILAGLPAVIKRIDQFQFCVDQQTWKIWAHIWRGPARWALFGALTHELASRSHIFVVEAVFGASFVGRLQAGEMLFRPLSLLGQAWERVAMPSFARFAVDGDSKASRSLERFGLVTILSVTLAFFTVLSLAWPLLTQYLFAGSYLDMKRIVLFWGAVTLTQLVSQIYSTELQGFARFRELGAIGAVTALVSTLMLVSVVRVAPFEWTILALLGANLTGITCMTLTLRRIYRSDRLASSIYQSKYSLGWGRILAYFR
jgi:O-antigen/teichoic acid export membrane protein